MAHKIRVKKVPHINKDGSPSKSKQDYFVSCQSRGKNCLSKRCASQKQADEAVLGHRIATFNTHRRDHPNDLAHHNKHSGGSETKRQVPSRFLPFHRRGEKHHEELMKIREQRRAAEMKESA